MKNVQPAPTSPFTKDTDVSDIMEDPHKFGCPTFEEYCKARDKFLPRDDDSMIMLTDGPKRFRNDLKKIKFQINGKDVLEDHVERALSDFGYTLADIDLENRNSRLKKKVEMTPLGGGKYDVVVNFLP